MPSPGVETAHGIANAGQAGHSARQSHQLARPGGIERDAAQQAFEVEQAAQRAAQALTPRQVGGGLRHCVQPLLNLRQMAGRAKQGRPQQPPAHGRGAGVQRVEERGLRGFAGKQGLDQFQIANRDGIQQQALAALVKAEGVNVLQPALLGLLQVVEQRAGGDRGSLVPGQAQPVERMHAGVPAQQRERVVGGKDPVLQRGFGPHRRQRAGGSLVLLRGRQRTGGAGREVAQAALPAPLERHRAALRVEQLHRTQALQLIHQLRPGRGSGKLRRAKLPCRQVQQRQSHAGCAARSPGADARQPVALLGPQARVDHGPRRKHPRDLAPDDLLRQPGVFHLIAQGDAVALAQKPLDVLFGRMVGNAAHRLLLLAVARGQSQLQLARSDDGVIVKELVEVANPAHHQAVGMRLLGGKILPHHGRLHARVGRGLCSRHLFFRSTCRLPGQNAVAPPET